jgi:hypothetical protein
MAPTTPPPPPPRRGPTDPESVRYLNAHRELAAAGQRFAAAELTFRRVLYSEETAYGQRAALRALEWVLHEHCAALDALRAALAEVDAVEALVDADGARALAAAEQRRAVRARRPPRLRVVYGDKEPGAAPPGDPPPSVDPA